MCNLTLCWVLAFPNYGSERTRELLKIKVYIAFMPWRAFRTYPWTGSFNSHILRLLWRHIWEGSGCDLRCGVSATIAVDSCEPHAVLSELVQALKIIWCTCDFHLMFFCWPHLQKIMMEVIVNIHNDTYNTQQLLFCMCRRVTNDNDNNYL